MRYKIGEEVICIIEDDLPICIGKVFKIVSIGTNVDSKILYMCATLEVPSMVFDLFPFFEYEIVEVSALIKELI